MDALEQQFADLQLRYPNATLERRPDGTAVIKLPEFSLPGGWSKPTATVAFVAPAGYPYAKPDCFWADVDLRLSSGGVPANSGTNNVLAEPMLWFSFHTSAWNPNKDSLMTYVNVIKARLNDLR